MPLLSGWLAMLLIQKASLVVGKANANQKWTLNSLKWWFPNRAWCDENEILISDSSCYINETGSWITSIWCMKCIGKVTWSGLVQSFKVWCKVSFNGGFEMWFCDVRFTTCQSVLEQVCYDICDVL